MYKCAPRGPAANLYHCEGMNLHHYLARRWRLALTRVLIARSPSCVHMPLRGVRPLLRVPSTSCAQARPQGQLWCSSHRTSGPHFARVVFMALCRGLYTQVAMGAAEGALHVRRDANQVWPRNRSQLYLCVLTHSIPLQVWSCMSAGGVAPRGIRTTAVNTWPAGTPSQSGYREACKHRQATCTPRGPVSSCDPGLEQGALFASLHSHFLRQHWSRLTARLVLAASRYGPTPSVT